jgi:hypothetical protein
MTQEWSVHGGARRRGPARREAADPAVACRKIRLPCLSTPMPERQTRTALPLLLPFDAVVDWIGPAVVDYQRRFCRAKVMKLGVLEP